MLSLLTIYKGIELYRFKFEPRSFSPGTWGATISVLDKACNGKPGRQVVLKWLFQDIFKDIEPDNISTKMLVKEQDRYALVRFVGARRIAETTLYSGRPTLEDECAAIWFEEMKKLGRLTDGYANATGSDQELNAPISTEQPGTGGPAPVAG